MQTKTNRIELQTLLKRGVELSPRQTKNPFLCSSSDDGTCLVSLSSPLVPPRDSIWEPIRLIMRAPTALMLSDFLSGAGGCRRDVNQRGDERAESVKGKATVGLQKTEQEGRTSRRKDVARYIG